MSALDDVVIVLGVALVVTGFFVLATWLGFVVAGVALIAAGFLISRGGTG